MRRIALIGPTSSGKTALSLELAERFNLSILNADSRQVYIGLDIGTGKVTAEPNLSKEEKERLSREVAAKKKQNLAERREGVLPENRAINLQPYRIKGTQHYGLDSVFADEPWSLAQYLALNTALEKRLTVQGEIPFYVGGTGLYVRSVFEDYRLRPTDPVLRQELESMDLGILIEELFQYDSSIGQRVDIKNPRRVIRAAEVLRLTGTLQPHSSQKAHGLILGLQVEKTELTERIRQRVKSMLRRGWIEEVEHLTAQGYDFALPALSSLGYSQICLYLRGEISRDAMEAEIVDQTIRFAKRQMTFFRGMSGIRWINREIEGESLTNNFLSD